MKLKRKSIKAVNATIFRSYYQDECIVYLNVPDPYFPSTYLKVSFTMQRDLGSEYILKNFGVVADVLPTGD